MDILTKHIEALKLNAADSKLVSTVSKRVKEIGKLADKYQHFGNAQIKQARFEIEQNPTEATVAGLATAILAAEKQDEISVQIRKALIAPMNAEAVKLNPLVDGLLDQLEKAVEVDLKEHAETLAKSPLGGAVDSSAAARVVESMKQHLNRHRATLATGGALQVLGELGLLDELSV